MDKPGGSSPSATEKGVVPFTARAYDTMGKTEDLRAFGIVVEEDATVIPPGPGESGCGCSSANGAEGSLAALFVLGLAAFVSRRRRS
jgi:MYXO-CTERM domain-containing protein